MNVNVAPLQRDFADALLAPALPSPGGIRAADRQARDHRFAVHRNNVIVSLVDALAESFPVTRALVGEQFFRAMARERVLADPPRSPVLIEYAQAFPDFIAGFAPAASVAYLADVARIEAMRVHAYHAADAVTVSPAAYGELGADPERLAHTRVDLHPACRWLHSRHAAHAIWSAHQGLDDMAQARMGDIDTEAAEDILVTRSGYDILAATLPRGAGAFLDLLRAGVPLADAFERARTDDDAVDPGALFSILIEFGLVVGLANDLEQ